MGPNVYNDILVAYHEAGHAVIDYLHGCELKEVSIDPDIDKGNFGVVLSKFQDISGKTPEELDLNELVMRALTHGKFLLAGAAAEYEYLSAEGDYESPGSTGDINRFTELLRKMKLEIFSEEHMQGWISKVFNLAKEELIDNWVAVESLANALLEKNTLDGKEAELIIRNALKSRI